MVKDVTVIVKEDQFNRVTCAVFYNAPILFEHPEHFDPKALADVGFFAEFVKSLNDHEFALCNQFWAAATIIRRARKPNRTKQA
jgi:hypothetical protein